MSKNEKNKDVVSVKAKKKDGSILKLLVGKKVTMRHVIEFVLK